MRFEEKLKVDESQELWEEYCGFLDISTNQFMEIQQRLMLEQIDLWCNSPLGKSILNGKQPRSVDEFREMVPLTIYEDYAAVLLSKDSSMLPDEPILWIQTTWEGGTHPIKVAPYTKNMLETYKRNMLGCLMLSTSEKRGEFNVNPKDTILYGLAPLPYATGLFPVLLNDEISIEFLPPVKDAEKMSFSQRNKLGFKQGLKKGIDFFFGVGSVTYFVSLSLSSMGSSSKKEKSKFFDSSNFNLSMITASISMLIRLLRGKSRAKKENRDLQPKDLFKLKGFMCAGTDNKCYKDDLERLWGVRPMEIFAGTEPTCIGTEIWSRDGLYLFPDACFYEFIHEDDMKLNSVDHSYIPKTYLLNEVIAGEKYELVVSVLKGGAFARYRVGDMYRCLGLENKKDNTKIPRFEYVDRVPDIIDIAGFTRITEVSIKNVLDLSGIRLQDWVAAKEFSDDNKPFLHLYIELSPKSILSQGSTEKVLREHLSVYFKYVDNDYEDLKKILGMEPLKITIIKCGSFKNYNSNVNNSIRKVNPMPYEIKELTNQ